MNLDDLNKLRDDQRNIERLQSKLLIGYLKNQSEFWEFQGLAEQIAFDKNNEDLFLLSNQLLEWSEKAKESNKKLMFEMYIKCSRIATYCQHLESVSKHSITLYRQEQKESKRLLSEKKDLELKLRKLELEKNGEIEKLKKQLEFNS